MKEIKLKSWSDFESTLRAEIKINTALVRNFDRVTFDNFGTEHAVEIDSLAVVRHALFAEHNGPTDLARIGVMRALHRDRPKAAPHPAISCLGAFRTPATAARG